MITPPMHHSYSDIQQKVEDFASLVQKELAQVVHEKAECPSAALHEALGYVISNPGKCIRSFLASTSAQVFGVSTERTLRLSAAIEVVHAYSLVHDDLPSMDNSPIRRGKESCHIKFGEAVAVLTGNALLTLTFELLSTMNEGCAVRCEIIELLSKACGRCGMIAGQMLDMEAHSSTSFEGVRRIHELKTARLFSAACEAGAVLGGASAEERAALAKYGAALGCAFQAKDDLSDAWEDGERCYGSMAHILGMDETQGYVDGLLRKCEEHLRKLPGNVDTLGGLVVFVENLSV
ncbi:geranyltranstransferase [Anaplasma marginale str. Dawn]|uniref:Geranyltranstransferase (Farnesyl-diphosphate synthase)(IspA) n=2 Tax=Anaplasma marginale TaxID=770 RepID=B9KJ22_ANAMF|nr:geranyltranstransferase (farnesyl-diphosphate synthase) [Anaplasma marginale str. St. Maries]ACM49484.1 geranyltranstransferase (farnesyl-diphosphate synthase)(ispA) [Anaplasma marginale str. Florida]AGZ78988.1 geranyltranstransferase [Anaplasma marginale str. Gypsy Plains]AGZ79804.1 geranyltranstransferase [Anaplasma marginale str. Dawn]